MKEEADDFLLMLKKAGRGGDENPQPPSVSKCWRQAAPTERRTRQRYKSDKPQRHGGTEKKNGAGSGEE